MSTSTTMTLNGIDVRAHVSEVWQHQWHEFLMSARPDRQAIRQSYQEPQVFSRDAEIIASGMRRVTKECIDDLRESSSSLDLSEYVLFWEIVASALAGAALRDFVSEVDGAVQHAAVRGPTGSLVILASQIKQQTSANLSAEIARECRLTAEKRRLKFVADRTTDAEHMRAAIVLAALCRSEDRDDPPPKVAAIAVRNGIVIGKAYRGELGPGEHAEFTLLERKLPGVDLRDSTLYVTLEPCCVRRDPAKTPCAHRIIQRRIPRVVIAMLDPNREILGEGIQQLQEAGVRVDLASGDEWLSIRSLNDDFVRIHRSHRTSGG